MPPRLTRTFFARPVHKVAPELIGATLLVDGVGGVIMEVEAYHHTDPAAHSYRGPTPRNAVMFGPPGVAYVYRSYGIHWCLNFVCEAEGSASAVLIRALEPTQGLAVMRRRRGLADERALCSGPGKLCEALGVTDRHNGLALDRTPFALRARRKARDGHRRAHRHHQGHRETVALWDGGVEVFKQAVQVNVVPATRPSLASRVTAGLSPPKRGARRRKAGTHSPCLLDNSRRMGPGSRSRLAGTTAGKVNTK